MATLLAIFAHPDDELTVAGTLLAQRARGDRVVVVWLTRGEMTEAFGTLPTEEVAARREALGGRAARLLDVEHRFLDFPDTGVRATPKAARKVAGVIAEERPDGLLTWGRGWVRGVRHPDHAATGRIAVDAVTLARIAKAVSPREPHRGYVPVFTSRGMHSTLPEVAVDVSEHAGRVFELAALYREELGFGDRGWLERRLRKAGERWGVRYAEVFDAWESPGGLVPSLLPAAPKGLNLHPDRDGDSS